MAQQPFIFDLETGGVDSRSSILSSSYTAAQGIVSNYSRPVHNSWISAFSEKNILPQLLGKSTISEKENIHKLIGALTYSTGTLAGYNITGFDIPFLKERAKLYGLDRELTQALRNRPILDVSWGVKDIISSSITSHATSGTFNKMLGSSWAGAVEQVRTTGTATEEFNAIHQAIGYNTARMMGKPSLDIQMAGWKLEDVHALLRQARGTSLTGQAHESATDVLMTKDLMEAEASGELRDVFRRPDIAESWVKQTVLRRQQTVEGAFNSGRVFRQARTAGEILRDTSFTTRLIGGVGLGMAAGATAIALSKLVSDDDAHNTITGLPHGGSGQQMRRALTDFGSGYRGIIKMPAAVEAMLGARYDAMVAKTSSFRAIADMGLERLSNKDKFVQELLDAKIFTKRGPAEDEFDAAHSAFTKFHLEISDAEKAGHEFVMGVGETSLSGGNLKALKAAILHERVHLGSAEITGEAGQLPGKSPDLWHDYLKSLKYNDGLESSYYEEFLAYSLQSKTLYGKPDPMAILLGATKASDQIDEVILAAREAAEKGLVISKVGQETRLQRIKNFKQRISGKDDAYNTIEGLPHGGEGHAMRKKMTPFGSGWDALRNLVKQGEKFDDMLRTPEFQKSLLEASEVGVIGEASKMGSATHMKSTFRGQEFSFIRKKGIIGEHEGSTMQKFQDDFAPSLYAERATDQGRVLDMEMFKGTEFRSPMTKGDLPESAMQSLQANVQKMHSAGYVHGDIHPGNAFLTEGGQVGIIDFGGAGQIGTANRAWASVDPVKAARVDELRAMLGGPNEAAAKAELQKIGSVMVPGNELHRFALNNMTIKGTSIDDTRMAKMWETYDDGLIRKKLSQAISPPRIATGAPSPVGSKTSDMLPARNNGAADDLFSSSEMSAPLAKPGAAADDLFGSSDGMIGQGSSVVQPVPRAISFGPNLQAKMQRDATSSMFDMGINGGKLSNK